MRIASLHRKRSLTWLLVPALLSAAGGCGRPRHAGEVPDSPQAALEAGLSRQRNAGTRRTSDGGILYTAQLVPGSPETVRVPYDLLKLECENHSGRFEQVAPPQREAASLATDDVPDPVEALLADADERRLFGQFRCEGAGDLWLAEIEPHALTGGSRPSLQIYARASAPDEGEYDEEAPAGPGLPAIGDARRASELPPPSPPGSPAGSPPGSPPSAAGEPEPSGAAPLDQQPPRPMVTGERLLADPRPFGVSAGVDSPEILAKKLRVELSAAKPCDSGSLKGLCWDKPSAEALSLRASFADLSDAPVLAELEVKYPAAARTWLARTFQNQFGGPDSTTEQESSWSWLHTQLQLTSSDAETRVYLAHKPTLDRAQLKPGTPGREPVPAGRVATPWQLQIGFEAAQTAQTKLQSAGFTIAETGCSDGGAAAQPVFTRTCPLRGGRMAGFRGAWVRTVDIGDRKPRLAELGYTLDKSALDQTVSDLKQQYGEPIPSAGGQLQWWTGSVGITLTPATDTFTLRYYHGRLLQYFIVAEQKRAAADKAQQRQGL